MTDSLTSSLSMVNQLDQVRDGMLRSQLFRIDCTAFKVWAHGVDPQVAINDLPEGTILTQTITLSIGGRTVNCPSCGEQMQDSTSPIKCCHCGMMFVTSWRTV